MDGEGPVTDESGEREGPLLEKHSTKRHSQPRSLLPLVEREKGSDKGPPTRPIGCKISSRPSWIELKEVGNTGEKARQRTRGERKKQKKHGGERKLRTFLGIVCPLDSPNKENTVKESRGTLLRV